MSIKREIVFRVDESTKIGFGHMSRCRALACAFLKANYQVKFICLSIRSTSRVWLELMNVRVIDIKSNNDLWEINLSDCLVIVDGYHFSANFWHYLCSKAWKTICIDDFRNVHYIADAVICYNEGVSASQFDLAPSTELFLGGKYILLRPEIRYYAQKKSIKRVRDVILIVIGGTQQKKWIIKILKHLKKIERHKKLWVLSGSAVSESKILSQTKLSTSQVRFFSGLDANALINLFKRTKYLITPASTLMLEAFTVGCPMVSGWLVENQKNSLQYYNQKKLIVNVGDLHRVTTEKLKHAKNRAISHSGRMIRNQKRYTKFSSEGIDEIVYRTVEKWNMF